jgi:hypothetical protein
MARHPRFRRPAGLGSYRRRVHILEQSWGSLVGHNNILKKKCCGRLIIFTASEGADAQSLVTLRIAAMWGRQCCLPSPVFDRFFHTF